MEFKITKTEIVDFVKTNTGARRFLMELFPKAFIFDDNDYRHNHLYATHDNNNIYVLTKIAGKWAFSQFGDASGSLTKAHDSGLDAINDLILRGFTVHTFLSRGHLLKFIQEHQ